MSELYDTLRKLIRQELASQRNAELATVQEVYPADPDNYACDLVLRDSQLVLKQVPLLTPRKGFASVPDVGAELFPFLPVHRLARIEYDTHRKLPRIRVPVLILHGRADTLVMDPAFYAGDIGAAIGLKVAKTGDTLSDADDPVILEAMSFPEPVIRVAIEPKTKADQDKLGIALSKLAEEDPTFQVRAEPRVPGEPCCCSNRCSGNILN